MERHVTSRVRAVAVRIKPLLPNEAIGGRRRDRVALPSVAVYLGVRSIDDDTVGLFGKRLRRAEVELLRHERRHTIKLVNGPPHIDIARSDALAVQFLRRFHKLFLVFVPDALQERETVEPSDDKPDVLLRVRPPRHACKVQLISGSGKTRRLAVGVGSIGVSGEVHRWLRMRRVSPAVAVFCREVCAGGSTQFVAEELVLAYALALGKFCPYGCGQSLGSVYLLDEEIYCGEAGKMEVAIL